MGVTDVLLGIGAILVVGMLVLAFAIDVDASLPGDPTKEEWRRH